MDIKQVMAGLPQNQNLIDPSKIDTTEKKAGFYKSIFLDIFSVLLAGLFGYAYYRYLAQGLSVWFLLGATVLFGVFSVLQSLLNRNFSRRFLVIILETVALIIFFRQDDWIILYITGVIVLVVLFWGYLSGQSRMRNSIQIPFFAVSGTVLGKFTTAVILFMILLYVPQLNAGTAVISDQNFNTFFDWVSGFVSNAYPTLSLNSSFGTFAESMAKLELQNNPNFESLNSNEQSMAIQQQAAQVSNNFSQVYGSTIPSSMATNETFYIVINGILSGLKSQSSEWFEFGWGAALFIILRSVGIIFVWLDQFVALMFYELLLACNFMKVSEENATKETLGY